MQFNNNKAMNHRKSQWQAQDTMNKRCQCVSKKMSSSVSEMLFYYSLIQTQGFISNSIDWYHLSTQTVGKRCHPGEVQLNHKAELGQLTPSQEASLSLSLPSWNPEQWISNTENENNFMLKVFTVHVIFKIEYCWFHK